MDKEQYESVARQKFDIPRWVESELSQIDLTVAVAEIIDNAIDETSPNETANMLITFDARSNRITFENKNTTGMNVEKMKEFPLWGGIHTDPNKIKEHRLGGKLAILSLLSKDKGSVTLTSMPSSSTVAYQMPIENWWQRLTPDEEFKIRQIELEEKEKEGITRFELTDVEEVPSNITDLADKLSVIYGPLIQSQRLSIRLRRYPPRGSEIQTTQVLPITVPFNDSLVNSKEHVPTGKKGKGPRITTVWGLLDQERKKRDESARRGLYEVQHVSSIRGDSLYLYYHGRLLSIAPLSTLRIPGHTVKHIFQSFVITVDIEKGWAPKTIFKKALSASAPETKDIYKKVVALVKEDVSRLAKESETEGVPARYKERVRQASTALATVLNEVFNNNTELMAKTFNLPTTGFVFPLVSEEQEEKPVRQRKPTLPGMTETGKGLHEKKRMEEKLPKEKGSKGKKKEVWVNPIPEFKISPFPKNSPEAVVSIDDDTSRPTIELNYTSPIVHFVLRQRGKVFVGELLRIGAAALYHEKWIRLTPKDSSLYAKGVQEDIAQFLSRASELKII